MSGYEKQAPSRPPPPFSAGVPPPAYVPQPSGFAPAPGTTVTTTTTTTAGRPASPAAARERKTVGSALTETIPAFHARLTSLLGRDCPIYVDFNSLLAPCTSSKARARAAEQIVTGLETLASGFELACRDPSVTKDIGSRVASVLVQPGVSESTNLRLGPSGVVYTCGHQGSKMSLSVVDVKTFFEVTFYAQERLITNLFYQNTLPSFQERLRVILGRDVIVNCDVAAIAATATAPTARVEIVKTLCADNGFARSTRKLGEGAERLMGGGAGVAAASSEHAVSEHVIKPLLTAIEQAVGHDPTNQVLRGAMAGITFQTLPKGSRKEKRLEFQTGVGASAAVVPYSAFLSSSPPTNCTLVYVGCFEDGPAGCLTIPEAAEFLEIHFRNHERALVNTLMTKTLAEAQTNLGVLLGHHCVTEMDWDTIFPRDMPPNRRLDAAKTLCEGDSKNVVQVLVKAIQAVHLKTNGGQACLETVGRVVIKGEPSGPAVVLEAASAPSGLSSLVYHVGVQNGLSGCFDTHRMKAAIRKVFSLATPKEDKGVGAALTAVGGDLTRMADKVGRSFSKLF